LFATIQGTGNHHHNNNLDALLQPLAQVNPPANDNGVEQGAEDKSEVIA